jgi:hypothetical protein
MVRLLRRNHLFFSLLRCLSVVRAAGTGAGGEAVRIVVANVEPAL